MTNLVAHIEAINAANNAAALADGYVISSWTTNEKYWAESGITTPEAFDRYMLEVDIWNAYEDGMGYKPRWIDFKAMSLAELEAEYASVCDSINAEIERKAERIRLDNLSWQEHLAEANIPVEKTGGAFAALAGLV